MPGINSFKRGLTKSRLKLAILVFSFLALLSACGGGQTEPPPAVVSVTLTPSAAKLYINESAQLTAVVHNSTNSAVTWSLSGAGCGGPTCGTITSAGLYTAPASVPSPPTVTVKATSEADTSKSASATITILATSNAWTWISGSNTANQLGIYGTQGTADPSNVPGARYSPISWTDSSGKFWLFGGIGYDSTGTPGYLNDLWNYDGTNWTWISGYNTANQLGIYGTQGIADPANVPGSREAAVSWIDSQGNLWLFGGVGYNSNGPIGDLNSFWKYDPTTLEWTWVSGNDVYAQGGTYGTKGSADPANVPGARDSAISWTDSSGNLWLFGGMGYGSDGLGGYLNDLWKYDPILLEWTWVSGSDVGWSTAPTYGTKGIADPSNAPGGRYGSVSWIDSSGNLWLFGGMGWGTDTQGYLNDLWKFDPILLEWTWVSGNSTVNQMGTYGTQGKADPANVPAGRESAVSWLDSQGNFWLFGGTIYDLHVVPRINDLWKFNPTTLEWTWLSGDNGGNQPSVYGTKGVADPLNVPGAREYAVSWIDSQGKLWLFGGWGLYSVGNWGWLNDLWQYTR